MEVSIEPQPVSAKPCCGKVLIDFPSQRQANIVRDTLEVDAEVRVHVSCLFVLMCLSLSVSFSGDAFIRVILFQH